MTTPRTLAIDPHTTTLFICDIQERFKGMIWQYASVIGVANKMLKVAKLLDMPIVVTEQYPKGLGNTVQELDIAGSQLCLAKTKFSMCVPEVAHFLKDKKIQSVIIVGIESHVCVLQTALDLLANNYDVYLLADGISSQNPSEIPVAVARMRSSGATITTSESIMFQLAHDAKHEKFKAISGLVKEYMEQSKLNMILTKAHL